MGATLVVNSLMVEKLQSTVLVKNFTPPEWCQDKEPRCRFQRQGRGLRPAQGNALGYRQPTGQALKSQRPEIRQPSEEEEGVNGGWMAGEPMKRGTSAALERDSESNTKPLRLSSAGKTSTKDSRGGAETRRKLLQ